MSIEEEILKRTHVNYNKLEKYGFKKNKNNYTYSKNILDNTFRVDITINNKELLQGKIIDIETNEEYINYRVSSITGDFASKIKEIYKSILLDIKNNCYETDYFISNQANRITKYINDKYKNIPEFLWKKFDGYGVFRNKNNNKWYAIIMNIDKSKISKESGEIEIINLKLSPDEVEELLTKKGYYKAYHMNNKSWISIILDNTLNDLEIIELLDKSYNNINNS